MLALWCPAAVVEDAGKVKELILGGVRSGKSRLAEARAGSGPVTYIATARAGDAEMAERIARHRARRPAHWRTAEAGAGLGATLEAEAGRGRCVLVDCLTLWLTGLIEEPERMEAETQRLLAVLPGLPGHVILVGNEVGLGVVPLGEVSRRFVDAAGGLHQALAGHCDRVTLVAAGLPLTLKGEAP